MADGLPPDDDPFGAMPFFGDMMKLFQGQAGSGPDTARQLARTIANEGQSEANLDPSDRIQVEELVRVAELHVAQATDLATSRTGSLPAEIGNRSQWADRTIDDYKPLFEALHSSMAVDFLPSDIDESNPMAAMMSGLSQMLGPMMLGVTTGSMVGHLAQRAFGGYDLPVPRAESSGVLISLRTVDEFGEDWSLDRNDLRLWVCLHEVAHHAVLNVAHVRSRLQGLLHRHASAFKPDPQALEGQLGELDLSAGPEALAGLQETLGNPDALLGAVRSAEQEAIQPELTALIAAITGYVDHVMDSIGSGLMTDYPMITEALRRRRVEADASDRFVERILGLELDADQYDRGTAFAAGVVERGGDAALRRLFTEETSLPTPAEVDAPGLWLARIDLPG